MLAVTVCVLALAVIWLALRLRSMHREVGILERSHRDLLGRVFELESARRPPEPARETPSETPAEPPPVPPPLPEPDRKMVSLPIFARDWEAIIGGNWLNKIGALVLVVGIALFLGYSLTHFGPAGKISLGLAIGVSMLAAGVLLERDPGWITFGRSLLGGGWAAIYFTTYAMHGLPAARVIESPFTATCLLLGVSVLMVLHSLRYRSEAATALAYLIAFVSLNITPLASFTVVAALVLALSLMLTAYRFTWFHLAVAGVIMTYGTFAATYEPAVYGRAGVLNGQSLLWIYWFVFETYDLIDLHRGRTNPALFLLNAAGFLGASTFHEWSMHASDWSVFFALAAAAHTASASLRARYPHSSYPVAATIAAGTAAAAIVEGFSGLRMTIALLIEGELIFIAGYVLRDRFLERLGGATLVLPVLRLPVDWNAPRVNWLTIAAGGVFYVNRFLLGRGWGYPLAGSALLMVGTARELPAEWVAPLWSAGLLALAWYGSRRDRSNVAWQAPVLAGVIGLWIVATYSGVVPRPARVLSAATAIVVMYAVHRILADNRFVAPIATVVLAAVLEQEVQGRLLTIAWGTTAAALLVAGFSLRDRLLRLLGLTLFLVCVAKLFVYDLRELDTFSRIISFIVLGLILLGASWIYTRYREQIRRIL
jgi:uncharacterized membrane protein